MRRTLLGLILGGLCVAASAQDRPREEGPRPKQSKAPDGPPDADSRVAEIERLTRELERLKRAEPRKGDSRDSDRKGGDRKGNPFAKDRPEAKRDAEPKREAPKAEAPKDESPRPTFGGGGGTGPAGIMGGLGGGGFGRGGVAASGLFGGADDGAVPLVRRRHVLPRGEERTITAILDKLVEDGHTLEVKREGEALVVTTTPEIDRVVTGLVRLLGQRPAKR